MKSSASIHDVNDHESMKGKVPFLGLFRYANSFDWLCIGVACLCSALVGYCQIHLLIVWTDAMDISNAIADAPSKKEQKEENVSDLRS